MTTMKMIAEKTGVSISTVSLVLNNRDAGRVKPAIAARIRQAAQTLGYQPNPLASSLRTSKTRILGFLSEEVATTPFAGDIILGSQDAASRLGYMMLTVNTDDESSEGKEITALQRYGVDGFLYAKMYNQTVKVPDSLLNFPVVVVDATDEKRSFAGIRPDEFAIGYDATQRLVAAGCRTIAYVGYNDGHNRLVAQDIRFAGYQQALLDSKILFDQGLVIEVTGNQEALDAVNSLFESRHPDGFFCFNDARAWYVYECAARRGLKVGSDISVVGVDNHRVFAETLAPRLTTIALPHYEMGYWSVCKLVSLIEGREPDLGQLPSTLSHIPPLDSPIPATIHCTLLEKESVVGNAPMS